MTDNALMTWESEGGYTPPDPDTYADTAEAVGDLMTAHATVIDIYLTTRRYWEHGETIGQYHDRVRRMWREERGNGR